MMGGAVRGPPGHSWRRTLSQGPPPTGGGNTRPPCHPSKEHPPMNSSSDAPRKGGRERSDRWRKTRNKGFPPRVSPARFIAECSWEGGQGAKRPLEGNPAEGLPSKSLRQDPSGVSAGTYGLLVLLDGFFDPMEFLETGPLRIPDGDDHAGQCQDEKDDHSRGDFFILDDDRGG